MDPKNGSLEGSNFRISPKPGFLGTPPQSRQKPEKRHFLGVHILNNILIALVVSNPDFMPLRGSHDSLKRGTRGKFRHTLTGPFPPFFKSRLSKSVIFRGPKTPLFRTFLQNSSFDIKTSKNHISAMLSKNGILSTFSQTLPKTRNLAFCQVSDKTTECDDQEHWFVCH